MGGTARGDVVAGASSRDRLVGQPVLRAEDARFVTGTGCFVDIRGLRLLLDVAGLVRSRGGRLVVVAPPICLRRMVAVLGLEARLPLATTAQQAVSRMHVHPADAVIDSIGRAWDGRW